MNLILFLLALIATSLVAIWFSACEPDERVTIRKSAGDATATEPQRKLKDVDVQFISLVGKGANNKTIVYKNADGSTPNLEKVVKIVKTDSVKKLVYGIVYAPDETDAHGDTMDREEIEKAAHSFLKNGRTDKVDKKHDEDPDEGYVVESYLIGKGDSRFPDQPAGSWAVVIKVTDDETWEQIENGEIEGISMQAEAKTESLEKAAGESARGFFGEVINEVKKGIRNTFRTRKSFEEKLGHDELRRAIWALNDALFEILWDDDIDDKRSAMAEDANAFIDYINNLELNKSNMNPEPNKKDDPEQTDTQKTGSDTGSNGQPASNDSNDLQKQIEELKKQNEELQNKVTELSKAAPGRQSEEGRENDDSKKKVSKGLPIFSNLNEE